MVFEIHPKDDPENIQFIEMLTMSLSPDDKEQWIGKYCSVCHKIINTKHKKSGLFRVGNIKENTNYVAYICSGKCFKIFLDNFIKGNIEEDQIYNR